MDLNNWAIKWGVSVAALEELRREMIPDAIAPSLPSWSNSESDVQAEIRLQASREGARLWRNNLGAVHTDDGRFIRYGLANDTQAMNKLIKSSDLIGIKPVSITHRHIGAIIGQFFAREVKAGNWNYSGTEREIAQLKFIQLVTSMGGDAKFTTGEL